MTKHLIEFRCKGFVSIKELNTFEKCELLFPIFFDDEKDELPKLYKCPCCGWKVKLQ